MINGKGLAMPKKEQLSEKVYEERHRVDKIGNDFFVQSMFAAKNETIDLSASFREKLENTFKKRVSNYANKLAKRVGMSSVNVNMDHPVVFNIDKNNGLSDHSLVQFTATIQNPRRKELN